MGLLPTVLETLGYELSRGQGYVLLGLMIALFLGMFTALFWPDSRSSSKPETQDPRRTEVITQLQVLLVENEWVFQSLAHPSINDPEDCGKGAQESYSALVRYYRINRIELTDPQLRQKIEDYLDMARGVLVDFFMLNDPTARTITVDPGCCHGQSCRL